MIDIDHCLSKFFVRQKTNSSCSIASVALLVNIFFEFWKILPPPERITEEEILKKLGDATIERAVAEGGNGVSLNECVLLVQKVFSLYFPSKRMKIDVVHAPSEDNIKTYFEKNILMLANFEQSKLIEVEPIGHFSVVMNEHRGVKVFDVDPAYPDTPYIVSKALLSESMHTLDTDSGIMRGYISIEYVTG